MHKIEVYYNMHWKYNIHREWIEIVNTNTEKYIKDLNDKIKLQ